MRCGELALWVAALECGWCAALVAIMVLPALCHHWLWRRGGESAEVSVPRGSKVVLRVFFLYHAPGRALCGLAARARGFNSRAGTSNGWVVVAVNWGAYTVLGCAGLALARLWAGR